MRATSRAIPQPGHRHKLTAGRDVRSFGRVRGSEQTAGSFPALVHWLSGTGGREQRVYAFGEIDPVLTRSEAVYREQHYGLFDTARVFLASVCLARSRWLLPTA